MRGPCFIRSTIGLQQTLAALAPEVRALSALEASPSSCTGFSTAAFPTAAVPAGCGAALGGLFVASAVPTGPSRGFSSTPAAADPAPGAPSRADEGEFSGVDPFALVRAELDCVTERLRLSVTAEVSHPVLRTAADYYFKRGAEGKRLRPTIMLLLASALRDAPPPCEFYSVDTRPPNSHPEEQHRQQQRIAEIAEMIHVASLLHDDVIDEAQTRRGLQALNTVLGPKVAILAGDFLLARASVTLASIRNPSVVELMARVIENLVSGEIMQMQATEEDYTSLAYYQEKSFMKTASLIANSCKSVAVLSSQGEDVAQLAFRYGQHLGLAFQLVDDVLDFTATSAVLGKPSLNDLKSGLATAPALYAAEEHPALLPLIRRKFRNSGDVERALDLIKASQGIQRSRDLAAEHAALAAQCIQRLPEAQSPYTRSCRRALIDLTEMVLTRKK